MGTESEERGYNKNTHCCCFSILNSPLIFCTSLYMPNEKKKKYSKFPSLLKLVMGSGADAFTTWNINFFIRPKVLGVNSLYCMKCQGNYRRPALFLRAPPGFPSPSVYRCTNAEPQCFHSAELLNRKGLDNVGFSKRRSVSVAGGRGGAELKVAKQNQVHGEKAESTTKYPLMSTPHFNRF